MVSFQCDGCADTVKKPKLDSHRSRCHAPFTCLDCSTTFQGRDYLSHTSCISEAQKYQGALYKGPKKGKQPYKPPQPTFTEAPPPPLPDPSAPSSPSGSATPAIHPSRLRQVQSDAAPSSNAFQLPSYAPDRGGYARGGGGFRGGRGGASGGSNGYPTSENRVKSSSGMRSWGSPVVTEDSLPVNIANPVPVEVEVVKKKKSRKGDKGGTGSKAGVSNGRPKSEGGDVEVEDVEPEKKKRKREENGKGEVNEVVPTEKTLKRLKKNLNKLEKGGEGELVLADWLSKAGKGKDGSLDSAEVLKGLKVSLSDGKWVLTA